MKIVDRFFQFNITLTQVVMDQVHFEIVDHLNAILQHGFLLLQRAMVVIYKSILLYWNRISILIK